MQRTVDCIFDERQWTPEKFNENILKPFSDLRFFTEYQNGVSRVNQNCLTLEIL